MSHAIDDLRHEHEAVLTAMDILAGIERRLAAGGAVSRDDLAALTGFLREFVDRCHHGKEEGLLFPALTRAGVPQQGGPLQALIEDHVQGRGWLRQMEASLAPALDAPAFARAARGYRELLLAHIRKENDELFPMAQRVLPPSQLDPLAQGFEAHELQVIGPGRHEQLHALLHDLQRKYVLPA
jgi:hemerythrin-like domain-containing protein